jgi:multiple sugar transport system permease protein
VFPFFFTIRNSFLHWNLQTSPVPLGSVGFANYKLVLEDPTFIAAIVNTLVITISGTAIEFVLGLAVALLLYEELKGTGPIRAVIIMPMTVAPMVAGLIFRYLMYNRGLIPFLLKSVGLPVPAEGILGSSTTVLMGIVLTDVWQWTPFFAIILLAGLQSISYEMIEQGMIDGASYFTRLFRLLLPNLNFVAVIIILIRFMKLFNLFDVIYAQTRGGPGIASRTLSYNLYYSGLVEFNVGYSSAMAVLMILMVLVLINLFILGFLRGREI